MIRTDRTPRLDEFAETPDDMCNEHVNRYGWMQRCVLRAGHITFPRHWVIPNGWAGLPAEVAAPPG